MTWSVEAATHARAIPFGTEDAPGAPTSPPHHVARTLAPRPATFPPHAAVEIDGDVKGWHGAAIEMLTVHLAYTSRPELTISERSEVAVAASLDQISAGRPGLLWNPSPQHPYHPVLDS